MRTPMDSDQDFHKFLKRVRREEKIYLEQLAEGLMTVSQLARIEKGQRPIPKNMRDRLLGRLGISSDLYENLLNIEDYAAWVHQRNILYAIERRDTLGAQALIDAYEKEAPVYDRIKQQFCLVMRAEVLRQQGADPGRTAACYDEAVRCTVPDIEHLCLEKKLLCIQEIDMILEYEFYHKDEDFAEKCRDLMTFVENAVYDDLSKVKVYPKIAFYYLREVSSKQDGWSKENWNEGLKVCNRAVEMLRDAGRAFFLLELLEIKSKILECMKTKTEDEKLQAEYEECTELTALLKKLSAECDVPAYMQDCTYLYQQRWVFYIGDVLRIRREMYGLTQKELSKGICSVRTLRRAEKKEANMQHALVSALLRKLGLSKEFQRARIVTNDREVLRLKREILVCRNNRNFEQCRKLFIQIREKISLDIPENRQYLADLEASLDWKEGKISKEEFAAREEKVLRCTLTAKDFFRADEIYLTEMELSCICKKIQGLNEETKKSHIEFLLHFFDIFERKCKTLDHIVMYEFVMSCVASELGDMGKFQISTDLDKRVLKMSLSCKRICTVDGVLYNILWNEIEQQKQCGQYFENEKRTKQLQQCILLSHFCRQDFNEKFYKSKLR
ncbi:MAG: helix-turn-helix domain-containing protein [Lachnospiraceae bacterium]